MTSETNKEYYAAAVKAINNLAYYYDELEEGVVAYLRHYFLDVVEEDLVYAVEQAISDVFFDGCEPETE